MSIRHGLLALLQGGPKHGYQLRGEFEAATGATWPLNVGQVYTTLARLERDGCVEPTGDADEGGKNVYRISAAGRDELAGWFEGPIEHDAKPRDELVIKLAMAVATPGVDALAVIAAQRAAAMRAIRTATRAKVGADAATPTAARLVAEASVFAAEAEVRWLDHCESLIRSAPAAPVPATPAEPVEPARSVTA